MGNKPGSGGGGRGGRGRAGGGGGAAQPPRSTGGGATPAAAPAPAPARAAATAASNPVARAEQGIRGLTARIGAGASTGAAPTVSFERIAPTIDRLTARLSAPQLVALAHRLGQVTARTGKQARAQLVDMAHQRYFSAERVRDIINQSRA